MANSESKDKKGFKLVLKDINVEIEKPKVLKFVRLSEKSNIYYTGCRVRTFLCMGCSAVVGSKLDHTKFHIDVEKIQYVVEEVNPIVKERHGVTALV